MRKKILGFTAAAFVLTMSTGITAFAGSWKEDAIGRYYENDDGSRPVYAGWFIDPADGAVYAMDPDGYTMPNSKDVYKRQPPPSHCILSYSQWPW